MKFELTVHGFQDGDLIPTKYTCEGSDVSPALSWEGTPAGTRSFALMMDDPDAPGGTWTHWLLWNIPVTFHSLGEHADPVPPIRSGANDFQRTGYGGPCPPKGHGAHRYFFRLFALDQETLDLKPGANRKQFDRAVRAHLIEEAVWMGRYERKR
jgi:Raf kinase inhibitor-like YbhB/YbcL family protein